MSDYLVDNNVVSALARKAAKVLQLVSTLPANHRLYTSAVVWGEIHAGNRLAPTTNPAKRRAHFAAVRRLFLSHILPVDRHAGRYYGKLVGELVRLNPYPNPRPKKYTLRKHLRSLGIDINDLWQAAQAIEHRYTLISTDDMTKIRQAAGASLVFLKWTI